MVTKRQLGITAILCGLFIILGVLGVDLLQAGRWSGFGPLQGIGLGLGAVCIVVGAILFRLGNRPA